jgi:hypothetical protein
LWPAEPPKLKLGLLHMSRIVFLIALLGATLGVNAANPPLPAPR